MVAIQQPLRRTSDCGSARTGRAAAPPEDQIIPAGVDIFEHGPDAHPGLLPCHNTVLIPHLGSATVQTRLAMANLAADNLLARLDDRHPPALLNHDAWEQRAERVTSYSARPPPQPSPASQACAPPPPRQRTTITGRSLRWITLCAVLPTTSPARSLLPLEPMMMMPASCSWASLTISRAACPYTASRTSPWASTPAWMSASTPSRTASCASSSGSLGVSPSRPNSRSLTCSTHTLPWDRDARSLAAAITRGETFE